MDRLKQQIINCMYRQYKSINHWYYFIMAFLCTSIVYINGNILIRIYGMPADELIEWIENVKEPD